MRRILVLFLSLSWAVFSFALQIERVSVDDAGNEGNSGSYSPSVSVDGMLVAFSSTADNLVSGDTNGAWDVFVLDRQAGTVERVSVNGAAVEGNMGSTRPSISGDGRYVAYISDADNLVAGDTNGRPDVFVFDRQASTVERVSVDDLGNEANDYNYCADISDDGRYVAFVSWASNLVGGDTNGALDVFLYDRVTSSIKRVSVDDLGNEGNTTSGAAGIPIGGSPPLALLVPAVSISGNNRYVTFPAFASNLVAGDTNNNPDIFVVDLLTDTIERVSVDGFGGQSNGISCNPVINADGRYVAFTSYSDNLVSGDTNGAGDAFVRDRVAGTTQRVSVDRYGSEGTSACGGAYSIFNEVSISADGRYVAFASCHSNLVGGDTNGLYDVFVRDRLAHDIKRVSVAGTGDEADSGSWLPFISGDGKYLSFSSDATNLILGDTNNAMDVFVVWDFWPTPAPTPVPPEHEELFISRNIFNPAVGETVEIRWAVLGTDEMFLGVYNTAGELVRKLEGQGVSFVGLTRTTEWDGRNDAGDFVASGVYVIHLKGSRSFSGKVVVVK